MSKYLLCTNCGNRFWSDELKCDCGVDEKLPECRGLIARLVVTHYEGPHPFLRGKGCGKKLCDGLSSRNMNSARDIASSHPDSVTCRLCLAHPDMPTEADPSLVIQFK